MINKDAAKKVCIPTCYICGSTGTVLFREQADHLYGVPGKWNIMKCMNVECGLLWLDPMPDVKDISKLYKQYYTHTSNKSSPNYLVNLYEHLKEGILASSFGYREATNSTFWLTLGRIFALVPMLRERTFSTVTWLEASKRGRLLDIGCGQGILLERMHKLGWNVVGIEPDKDAAEIVRSDFGLDVRSCSLDEAKFQDLSFDVITMHHVIEHLPDPLGTLLECRRILRSNGLLVVITPNSNSCGYKYYRQDWRGLEVPRHLYVFNPNCLNNMLIKAGFTLKKTTTLTINTPNIWLNSDSIKAMRLNKGRIIKQKNSPYFTLVKRLLYLTYAGIIHSANPNSGEEILVIAMKP
jgi:2-polyprenyl-3-methyl-5-hydroxy-6-metoxy-1,4-benzoquinol methylase